MNAKSSGAERKMQAHLPSNTRLIQKVCLALKPKIKKNTAAFMASEFI